MPSTYEPIATQTLSSAAATVTFSSISGSYTDLRLVINYGTVSADQVLKLKLNSDTGTNYSNTIVYGNGTIAGSSRSSSVAFGYVSLAVGTGTNAYASITTLDFMNYSNTTTYKTTLGRTGNNDTGTSKGTEANVILWRSTSAINDISFSTTSGNILAGSNFTLYGIKAA